MSTKKKGSVSAKPQETKNDEKFYFPEVGQTIWFEHPEESWILGVVSAINEKKKKQIIVNPKDKEVTPSSVAVPCDKWSGNIEDFRIRNDLLELTELHESSLLYVVKNRFSKDVCYTFIGDLILSINPFNFEIPWYKDDQAPRYIKREENLPPHVWSIADKAFRKMKDLHINQSILVSGESGAGKTEATKSVIKYLTKLSCTMTDNIDVRKKAEVIAKKIQESSPILEAFGNSKTINNTNSSRFGKFIKLQFDKKGVVLGAVIDQYLLEKSRVITCGEGERAYHIFYELLAGASDEERSKYKLKTANDYKNLTKGNCISIKGVDDAEMYKEVREAMKIVGMSAEEQDSIFRIVAAILHLQNVGFKAVDIKGAEGSAIDNYEELKCAAELLKVEVGQLQNAITTMTRVVGSEVIISQVPPYIATDYRDALCKALYQFMFEWIVEKINKNISTDSFDNFIGLLDIFGFEQFKVNSFEQLCINYANESLQSHYNHYTFTRDKEECEAESIDLTHVTFNDNTKCVQLIGGNQGILHLLDDACKQGTDQTYLSNLRSFFFKKHAYFDIDPRSQNEFITHHYAGSITYNILGWIEKNKDTLKPDIVKLLQVDSKDKFIRDIIPEGLGKQTVSYSFRKQLESLMNTLHSTSPQWIRCVKPHKLREPKPQCFVSKVVMNQLRSSGVLETIRIRKEGYSIRIPHQEFWRRYGCLLRGHMKSEKDSYEGLCREIIARVGYGPEKAQVGKTKVFVRHFCGPDLDQMRLVAITQTIIKVQAYIRRFRAQQIKKKLYYEKHKEEIERKRKEEEERKRAEEERKRKEEEERKRREEEERRRREEEERKRREEEERRKKAEEERLRRIKEEEERKKREKEERERREREFKERLIKERERLEALLRKEQEKIEELERQEQEKIIKAEEEKMRERLETELRVKEEIIRQKRRMELAAKDIEEKRLEIIEEELVRQKKERELKESQRAQKLEKRRRDFEKQQYLQSVRKQKAEQIMLEEQRRRAQEALEARRVAYEAKLKVMKQQQATEEMEKYAILVQYEKEQQINAQSLKERRLRNIENTAKMMQLKSAEKSELIEQKLNKAAINRIYHQLSQEESFREQREHQDARLQQVRIHQQDQELQQLRKQLMLQMKAEKEISLAVFKKDLYGGGSPRRSGKSSPVLMGSTNNSTLLLHSPRSLPASPRSPKYSTSHYSYRPPPGSAGTSPTIKGSTFSPSVPMAKNSTSTTPSYMGPYPYLYSAQGMSPKKFSPTTRSSMSSAQRKISL